ncbi:MAG: hypothetical protein OEZ37_07490, partial [Gemmatimonadota bacterium]|nr:hypothetical protein [Gemmatimonadota bacterium]
MNASRPFAGLAFSVLLAAGALPLPLHAQGSLPAPAGVAEVVGTEAPVEHGAAFHPERADDALEGGAPAQETGRSTIVVPRGSLGTPLIDRLRSVVGLLVLTLLAWLLSVNRSKVPWRVVGWGLSLQLVFALFILKTPMGESVFTYMNTVVVALLGFTVDGASFVFGNLVWNNVPVGAGP